MRAENSDSQSVCFDRLPEVNHNRQASHSTINSTYVSGDVRGNCGPEMTVPLLNDIYTLSTSVKKINM